MSSQAWVALRTGPRSATATGVRPARCRSEARDLAARWSPRYAEREVGDGEALADAWFKVTTVDAEDPLESQGELAAAQPLFERALATSAVEWRAGTRSREAHVNDRLGVIL